MNWKSIILFLITFFHISHLSASDSYFKSFSEGNESYFNKNYEKAVGHYLKMINYNKTSWLVYYNLGNAYFKNGQITSSIYFWEKSRKIKETKKVLKNLELANSLMQNKIEPVPQIRGLSKLLHVIKSHSQTEWLVFLIISLWIGFTCFYFITAKNLIKEKRFLYPAMAIVIMLNTFTFAGYLSKLIIEKQENTAIIFEKKLYVNTTPDITSNASSTIYEGTKIWILDEVNDWIFIKLVDGRKGWICTENLKII